MLMSQQSQPQKIGEIEGLRGILAWWVVLGHILAVSGYTTPVFQSLAELIIAQHYAVDVFVIISGFVIFLLIHQKRETFRVYIGRRFLRLYPVYILCFFLAVLLHPLNGSFFLFLQEKGWHDYLQYYEAADGHFWTHISVHLTMLHSMIPESALPFSPGAFLPPAWSISLEWQLYIVAPALYFFLKRYKSGFWAVTLAVALAYQFSYHLGSFFMDSFMPFKAHFFWIGGASYFIYDECVKRKDALSNVFTFLPLVALAILLFAGFIQDASHAGRLTPLVIWTIVFSSILSVKVNSRSLFAKCVSRLLTLPQIRWLGLISYNTYLIHWPLIIIFGSIFPRLFEVHRQEYLMIWLLAAVVPSTLICSILLHRYIEKPGIAYGRKLAKKVQLETSI